MVCRRSSDALRFFRHCERSEAIQQSAAVQDSCIASSSLLAMATVCGINDVVQKTVRPTG
jgi:hypothetical protein